MSNRPLFAVGEDVYLVSVASPESNGEGQVRALFRSTGRHRTGSKYCGGVCQYSIGITSVLTGRDCWCQCALRKRYPPADSFESIMNGLKEKIPA